jgi:Caspase domain
VPKRSRYLLMLLAATAMLCSKHPGTRSVRPIGAAPTQAAPVFSREEATGLFVGVRHFPHDESLEVQYAADDAVDLAHRFVLDRRVGLVAPLRAVLVLSGTPRKDASTRRLEALKKAGVRVVKDATAGDILHLLKEQAALAGNGIFVLSIASHGFQQNGDGYILGSTSAFGSPETSLRTATILDVAGQARRSVVFIDACRDRADYGSRGARRDPAAAAPHISRMKRMEGQVIFYAAAPGEVAYDDPVRGNGVFTRAVLDGLNCEASSPNETVVASTLHSFVDAEVRRWIRDHKNRVVNPATQVTMEGETPKMPLSVCSRSEPPDVRIAVDRSVVNAYDTDGRPRWRKELPEPVVHAEAADLDADAFYEVVVGLGSRIVVFDSEGTERWSRAAGPMTLKTFTTGDLYEKKTKQVVAIWNDSHNSRLTVFDSDGDERSRREQAGILQHVAIGRPTNMHAPKIAVAGDYTLLLLHAKKLQPLWRRAVRAPGGPIDGLDILDGNGDTRHDIAVDTGRGRTFFTFDGKVVR